MMAEVKVWYAIGFGGILLAGGIYVYQHRANLGLDTLAALAGASPNEPRPAHMLWHTIDHTPDGFTVELPDKEKQEQVNAQNSMGGSEPVSMISASPDEDTVFSVAWADDPPVARSKAMDAEKTMDAARDAALARTQSTLVSEKTFAYGGAPAREFIGRNANGGVFNARLILPGRRLYMLIAAFPAPSARRDKDVQRFFNSFNVIDSTR
jgi:hypothetical protein